jgi:Ran GTPase-activating protein (RanGAP) involved in mRNA processing and transport
MDSRLLAYAFLPDFGDYEAAADTEILRRLSQNDPDIRRLTVNFYDDRIVNNQDWAKEVGLAISKSKHLRSLWIDGRIDDDDEDDDDDQLTPPSYYGLPSFFMGLAENRSIEDLILYPIDRSQTDIFTTLAPFFEHTRNLRRIGIYDDIHLRERIPSLISALKQAHGLEFIEIAYNELGDSIAADLIKALRSMPGLHNLSVLGLGGNMIGQQGCAALCKLLRHHACKIECLCIRDNHLNNACMDILYGGLVGYNDTKPCLRIINKDLRSPTCSILDLNISGCEINDEGALTVASALMKNNSMELLDMCDNRNISSSGWNGFFHIMRQYEIRLKHLDLSSNNIDDEGATMLATILVKMSALNSFKLRELPSVSSSGWIGFFRNMRQNEIRLQTLDLSGNNIDDEGAALLFTILVKMSALANFYLCRMPSVSSSGWIGCFEIMMQYENRLKQLDLSGNNIDDVGAAKLVTILVKMSALENFYLCNMTSVTTGGWREFANVVKPTMSTSKLRELNLGRQRFSPPLQIDESVITCFADALFGNTSLRTLLFCGYVISEVGLRTLANCLCDKSSLIDTFHSNHTLQSIFCGVAVDEGDLRSLLIMNKCMNKFEVARRKILAFHFGDGDGDECVRGIFAPLPISSLPTALSWIGRDRREFSMMYNFLHNMPHLLRYHRRNEE